MSAVGRGESLLSYESIRIPPQIEVEGISQRGSSGDYWPWVKACLSVYHIHRPWTAVTRTDGMDRPSPALCLVYTAHMRQPLF
jgi:hypothetical protein